MVIAKISGNRVGRARRRQAQRKYTMLYTSRQATKHARFSFKIPTSRESERARKREKERERGGWGNRCLFAPPTLTPFGIDVTTIGSAEPQNCGIAM